jgi:hypothetical protein
VTNQPGNYYAKLVLTPAFTSGQVNLAYDSGAGRVARVPNAPEFYTNSNFSIQAWVKGTSVGNYKYVIAKARHPSFYSASYGLYSADTGGLKMFIVLDGATFGFVTANKGAEIWDDNWHQVTGTWDGNNLGLYVDGVLAEMSDSFGGGDIAYTNNYLNGDLVIGDVQSSAGSFHFPGKIDEVKFFNRALSDVEVADMYTNLTSQAASNALVSAWKLEGNINDSTSNHHGYVLPPDGALSSDVAVLSVLIPPPSLVSPGLGSGSFHATVTDSTGGTCVVLRSSDLINWTPITTNTAPFTFTDPIAAGGKFYRAMRQ